jgi:hypothetical protein
MIKNVSILRVALCLVLNLVVGSGIAFAECARDRSGAVHCATEPAGGATRDNAGNVVCGKGQCRRDRAGTVRCSVVSGGGADIDVYGAVQCLGGCEVGGGGMCQRATQ